MKQTSTVFSAFSIAALSVVLTASLPAQGTPGAAALPAAQETTSTAVAPQAAEQAKLMVTARASLQRTLDAKKDKSGDLFETKLGDKVHLDNGVDLPKGSVLMGKVVDDEMNAGTTSRLTLRFTGVRLKDGKVVPVTATIVGMYPPELDTELAPQPARNTWKPEFLVIDQAGVLKGVDLHSRIGGASSGTLVSSTKSEMKLGVGSQFALAIRSASPATEAEATAPLAAR